MSVNLLQKVKQFFVGLRKDQAFRIQQATSSIEENTVKDGLDFYQVEDYQVLQKAVNSFLMEELEQAVIELLELQQREEWDELGEEEVVEVVSKLLMKELPGVIVNPVHEVIHPLMVMKTIEQPMPIDSIAKPIIQPFGH
ncbi:MAG: hypothetical protein ACHBN1_26525 [Heteroscytonema crispum UTEX LB 1556]